MSLDLHSHAEKLMSEGDQHAASGNNEAAAESYLRAAELEAQAFEQVASDKVRTRGVLAVSAVSLFRKAGAADDALRHLHYFLGRGDLPTFANADLTTVLYEMYGEKANEATSSQLSPDTFEWVLRGPRIGIGAAPAEAVVEAITHAAKYGIRVYEFLAGLPLRMSGAASAGVLDAFAMQISEPQAGSFRFRVRLGAPAQSVLFEDAKPVTPAALGSAFASILEAATTQGEGNALDSLVADTGYQTAFFRLIRLLVPDGKAVSEIEVRRTRGSDVQSTLLLPGLRSSIDRQVKAIRPQRQKETERSGILRALHLNEGWIALGAGSGAKCYVDPGAVVLEDVAAELINKLVLVEGYWQGKKFLFNDIVAAGS